MSNVIMFFTYSAAPTLSKRLLDGDFSITFAAAALVFQFEISQFRPEFRPN